MLPAAFTVSEAGVEIIPSEEDQLTRVRDPSFAPETSVVLGLGGGLNSALNPSGSSESSVEWLHRGVNDFELKVNTTDARVLVISQMYYPGWKATIDSNSVPVVPANYALTAIHVPAGNHKVHFEYAPLSIRLGALLSALSLIAIAGMAVFSRKRQAVSVPGDEATE